MGELRHDSRGRNRPAERVANRARTVGRSPFQPIHRKPEVLPVTHPQVEFARGKRARRTRQDFRNRLAVIVRKTEEKGYLRVFFPEVFFCPSAATAVSITPFPLMDRMTGRADMITALLAFASFGADLSEIT